MGSVRPAAWATSAKREKGTSDFWAGMAACSPRGTSAGASAAGAVRSRRRRVQRLVLLSLVTACISSCEELLRASGLCLAGGQISAQIESGGIVRIELESVY